MSRKRKRKSQSERVDLFASAQREMAKGNAKVALKNAVLCYREDASPAHRQLLEEAYVGRVEQLHRKKQTSEARFVLARLLEIDPTTPEVREIIPHLQVILGDSSVDANGVFEKNPALLVEQTDRAVLDSREAVPDFAGTKSHVEQVRDALAAIEGDDDAGAINLLSDIPRSSPLCDWKLFIRGLIAFYNSDSERMRENWHRLDSARPAYRVAQTLLVASGELRCEDAPMDVASSLRRLELHLRDDPAIGLLEKVAEHWRGDDQSGFFNTYRRLRLRFANTHRSLLEKIVDFVWKRAVRENDIDAINRLARIGPAPALDPNWNRARALLAEHPEQSQSSLVESYWTAYADDVETLAVLREEERAIAVGMVYSRLGQRFAEYGEAVLQPSPFFKPEVEEADRFFAGAIRFFEESIRRCPRLEEAYQGLSMLHETMESPEKGAAVLQRLVQQQPDDYFARWKLATYYLGEDNPHESAPHVETVARLKPRDSQTVALCWNQRIAMARSLAKGRKFEAARQELERAAQSLPPNIQPYAVDILRAAIEFKAKRAESGQQYLNAALSAVDEPTIIWMRISIAAARFSLPRKIKKDFDDQFKEAIKKKPSSQTAGRLAETLTPFKVANVKYTGQATHERLVIAYLNRAKRVRWNEEDLCNVCRFLEFAPKHQALRERMIKTGVKKFPNSARLHYEAGQLELEGGPSECNINRAERHMNRVVELAAQSADSSDQKMVEMAKRALGVLRDTKELMASPFSSPFAPPYWDDEEEDKDSDNRDRFVMSSLFGSDDDEESDCDDYGRMQTSGVSLDDLDAATFLDEMKQTLPRPLVRQLERTAAKTGTNLVDLMGKIIKEQMQGDP